MYHEEFSHGVGVAYYREDDLAPSLWTHEDICGIYVRLLNLGFLDPQLVPDRLMEYYGMRLGHHARLAREEREQRACNAEGSFTAVTKKARHLQWQAQRKTPMSEMSVVPFPKKVNMLEPVRYRIRHIMESKSHWSWAVSGIWGLLPDARIFTSDERNELALPERGYWERIVEDRLWCHDVSTEKVGVYYGGPIWTNEELAERFGRKVVDGLIGNTSLEFIEYYARLAASYARMAIEEREQERCSRVHPKSQALKEVRS